MSSEEHYTFSFSNSLEDTFIEMPKEEPSKNNSFISAKCEPFYGIFDRERNKIPLRIPFVLYYTESYR